MPYSGANMGLSSSGFGGGEHGGFMPCSWGSGVGDCTVTRATKPWAGLCGSGEMSMLSLVKPGEDEGIGGVVTPSRQLWEGVVAPSRREQE